MYFHPFLLFWLVQSKIKKHVANKEAKKRALNWIGGDALKGTPSHDQQSFRPYFTFYLVINQYNVCAQEEEQFYLR